VTINFRVHSQDGDVRHLVTVEGEVDLSSAPLLEAELSKALVTTASIIIDLTNVVFIDTSGVRVLLVALKTAHERGIGFHLVAPAGPARRVIELTGLAEALAVVDSIDDLGPLN
jgi:anti-sigma B factor antagonist